MHGTTKLTVLLLPRSNYYYRLFSFIYKKQEKNPRGDAEEEALEDLGR